MKIFDCVIYFDEDLMLDLRLNILNQYVEKFIIVEAGYDHQGNLKKKNFNIQNFKKFEHKIDYFFIESFPDDYGAWQRENYQRNYISKGISNLIDDDFIIVSDIDEIPNLEKINNFINNKYSVFEQRMFYYKLNLYYKLIPWYGSKACKKKHLESARWIQWIKNKKYPLWRLDILFSKKKYHDIHFITDGGWHFTNIKSPEDIKKKLKSFVHYKDFESSKLSIDDLKRLINEKKVMYNHKIDKKEDRWKGGEKLQTLKLEEMPKHIIENYQIYKPWLETM